MISQFPLFRSGNSYITTHSQSEMNKLYAIHNQRKIQSAMQDIYFRI